MWLCAVVTGAFIAHFIGKDASAFLGTGHTVTHLHNARQNATMAQRIIIIFGLVISRVGVKRLSTSQMTYCCAGNKFTKPLCYCLILYNSTVSNRIANICIQWMFFFSCVDLMD